MIIIAGLDFVVKCSLNILPKKCTIMEMDIATDIETPFLTAFLRARELPCSIHVGKKAWEWVLIFYQIEDSDDKCVIIEDIRIVVNSSLLDYDITVKQKS